MDAQFALVLVLDGRQYVPRCRCLVLYDDHEVQIVVWMLHAAGVYVYAALPAAVAPASTNATSAGPRAWRTSPARRRSTPSSRLLNSSEP